MDFARFVQIYIIQGLFALFFLYMAFRVLRRGTKRLNIYLSSFYLSVTIGGIINMIYATIFDPTIVFIMHFITYYLFCFSMAFLLIFVLILMKPGKQIKFEIQLFILIIFGLLVLSLLLIPNGIKINDNTNWKPDWSLNFLIYSMVVCSIMVIIPTVYYSQKIYIKFENEYLKKKWKYFLIGIYAYFFLYYGTSISNTLNNDSFRFIWSLISLPTLISLYLIYYGVGRQLE
ncbi:MAG: hypothetical protein ACFE9I_00115 [Candidatus Hermodarchaeota archaeon]